MKYHSMSQSSQGQYKLAKFAFNIYGSLGTPQSNESVSPSSSLNSRNSKQLPAHFGDKVDQKPVFTCERETQALSQLNVGVQVSNYNTGNDIRHHAVVGGKNYLRLLCMNEDQSRVLQEINLLDTKSIYTSRASNKLNNINTIRTRSNTVACGLANGAILVYKVSPTGQSKLQTRFTEHKRSINSLDFIDSENVLVSGSQDGSMKLWDLRTSVTKPVLSLHAALHNDPIRACQYSPHSAVRNKICILSVHDSGALCKFDLRSNLSSNAQTPDRKWTLHSGPVLSLNIHPEKEYVATGGRDQKICIFNYSDSQSSTRTTPESMINTYGSILKVRWSPYSNHSQKRGEFNDRSASTLSNYDIACSYLNDDPTITTFNLNRKYIPKRIVHSYERRPVSNFVWAHNEDHCHKIWALTKSNVFTTYNLDSQRDPDVSRPLEDLNSIAMTWDSNDNFMMVNQDKYHLGYGEEFGTEVYDSGDERSHHNDHDDTELSASSLGASPVEKPSLIRSYSYNPMSQLGAKSPPPISRHMNSFEPPNSSGSVYGARRPVLTKNPSQESLTSFGSAPPPASAIRARKGSKTTTPFYSPYVVPVALPLPSSDGYIHHTLSNGYLMSVPDGFGVYDVCIFNSNVANGVGLHRTCQVWKMLAENLPSGLTSPKQYIEEPVEATVDPQQQTNSSSHIDQSIQSDLGNVIGSFNSNSTHTNHFGNSLGRSPSDSVSHYIASSAKNSRTNSFTRVRDAHEDVQSQHSRSRPISIKSEKQLTDFQRENVDLMSAAFPTSSPNSSGSPNFSNSVGSISKSPRDAMSSKLQPQDPTVGKLPGGNEEKVSEVFSVHSKLSASLNSDKERVWSFQNLLRKSLDYAQLQGDIVFCSVVGLLFYETTTVITKEECLDWLSMYIDILQKKQQFVIATNVINSAPLELQQELTKRYTSDLIRLYCSFCSKLLVNEESKHNGKGEFGYWYCDSCRKMQSNCIYCNEPSKGLVVLVSLKCGHRGHYGCLKEWFVDGGNSECPGGCDYNVLSA
ncbi:RTC1 [Candida theae]|uniref:Restriction of telomere capping protein 1 n=1 Tax=Candida theae TaxID=1198502 RepID=A0AAD5BGQ1_9ASCO|nr:RTC1 [Candida theae]KAI5961946.1 RTC1 [Candida theae]